jgi:Cellulose-binding Sde182, nucleoside hydrolase-like domain/Cellulose-binding protein Sde0182, C-terminal domain
MKKYLLFITVIFLAVCSESQLTSADKPRTIITTDGEVDDMDSFIRMLLYSNEFNIEGLIYSSSMWHYAGDGKETLFTSEMPMTAKMYGQRTDLRWTGTTWMEELINKYAQVFPNLIKHDKSYPSPEYLKSIIRIGNIEFEGEMSKDTRGSDLVKSVLLDDKPGKVYLQMWGGTNTVARALKSIEDQYKGSDSWDQIYRKVSGKAVLYIILDQDATYKKYIVPNWPDVKVIYNSSQFGGLAYWWYRVVPKEFISYLEGPWFSENIRFNHGALLESYFLWGDGRKVNGDPEHTHGDLKETEIQGRKEYDFISEGDSPSYLYLIDFGLRSLENPSFGGLGGRFVQSTEQPSRWADGKNVADFNPYSGKAEPSYPQVRWIKTLQNDFAVRADWCVMDYNKVNHAPVVKMRHSGDISVKPGSMVRLRGIAIDPDGDHLNYTWWQYKEAGTCDESLKIDTVDEKGAVVHIPSGTKPGKTIHLILEVTDDGTPNLTRYQRIVVTVK